MSTYDEYSNLPVSEKIQIAWLEPAERLLLWTLHSGAVYKKTVSHFVIDIKVEDTSLTQATSSTLSAGEWFYDLATNIVYVRLSDDSNPDDSYMIGFYRKFYANKPLNLPHDLTAGSEEVHYEGMLKTVSAFNQEVDNSDLIGVALENSGSISFHNTGGEFDAIFDKLFWESKNVKIYSWNEDILLSEKKLLFTGEITNKRYSEKTVSFSIKDQLFRLRQPVTTGRFSLDDGDVNDDIIGKAKRLVFGKVDSLRIQSITQIMDGVTGVGTLSGVAESSTITGSGTGFNIVHSPGDVLKLTINDTLVEYKVNSITDEFTMTIDEEIDATFSGASFTYVPEEGNGIINRKFMVAGHKLRAPSTTVSAPIGFNSFTVADITDFLEDDFITIGSETNYIKRISGSNIITRTNLNSLPSIGTAVSKSPVSAVYYNGNKIIDYTVSKNSTSCEITLAALAEFNVTRETNLGTGTITFTNGSDRVTSTENDFTNLKTNQYIRSGDPTHSTWYKVMQIIDENTLDLRSDYSGSNIGSTASTAKLVKYVSDCDAVTCDCIGYETSTGSWVKTASDGVKHLIEAAGLTGIDDDSFTQADIDAPYILSLAIPNTFLGEPQKTRDAIDQINQSVFGSLFNNSDFEMSYNILSAETPNDLTLISDDDIIDYSVATKTDTYKTSLGEYNHFDAGRYTGDSGFSTVEYESDFNKYLTGSTDTETRSIRLYREIDAQIMVERSNFYKSLAQAIIQLKGKLKLSNMSINDKLLIDLDRFYERYGEDDNYQKVAIISKIIRNGLGATVELSDISNIFNRSAKIADNASLDYTSATSAEKILNGYIVDNDTEIPDTTTESAWGTNLIS